MTTHTHKSVLSERQARLVQYWKSKRVDGAWPSRCDINPGEVRCSLANISLVELSDQTFRFRLTGSRIQRIFGKAVVGQLLHDIDASVEEAGSASMALALETGRPISGSRRVGEKEHSWLRLPLLNEAGDPQLVLCYDEISDLSAGPQRRTVEYTAVSEGIAA
ncbi:MAG: PAS domain-containing protein [Pseudomonadota bacterium]